MSKAALKKELSSLSASQLVEVILDAYNARPEIKEYFEYYLNPDVEKLTDKCMKTVVKELNRSKYHTSKARVSVINKTIKLYHSYSPGADNEVKFIVRILRLMGMVELAVDLTDTHCNLVENLLFWPCRRPMMLVSLTWPSIRWLPLLTPTMDRVANALSGRSTTLF